MVNNSFFAEHIDVSEDTVEELLKLGTNAMYQSSTYKELVASIDQTHLNNTVRTTRKIYDKHLPELIHYLRNEHGFTGNPMTSTTLSNWVLGFLNSQSVLDKMQDFHENVPLSIFREGLPHVLEMLDDMGDDGHEWKKAITLLALPFFGK